MKREFEVDGVVYSGEALRLAANVPGLAAVKVKGSKVEVTGDDPETAFREFLNEALNQQCRMDLVKKNFKISQLVLANALVSALGRKDNRGN